MRHETPHASTRFVIHDAMALVAKDAEQGDARSRLVEHCTDEIDQGLRARPFTIEARLQKFLISNEICSRHRFADLGEVVTGRDNVELHILFEIELLVMRIDATIIVMYLAVLAARVL